MSHEHDKEIEANLDEICLGHIGKKEALPPTPEFANVPKCATCKADEYNHFCPNYYPIRLKTYEVHDENSNI